MDYTKHPVLLVDDVFVCVDAVAGSQHLAVPKHLPVVLERAAVPLPLQDAWGES